MATKTAKHTHRLQKHKYKTGQEVFFCTLPECHFKIEAPLALGKESLCHQCGDVFIMNEYTIKLKRPHCHNCGKKQIKTADGRRVFVSKRSVQVLQAVAADDVNSLRNRLNNLVGDDEEEI